MRIFRNKNLKFDLSNARLAGLRVSALLEIFLFLALALFIDQYFAKADRFWGISPHPFWIIVLLITVQYGSLEGLSSAFFVSCALLVGNLPERPINVDLYQYWAQLIVNPCLWICTALVLGEIVSRHRAGRRAAEEELGLARDREALLVEEYSRIREHKDKLERQFTGQTFSAVNVLDALRMLNSLEPKNVLSGIREFVRSTIHPRKFSLFLTAKDGLELGFSSGWSEADSYLKFISSKSALFDYVVNNKKIACCANSEHEKILGQEAVLAAPLIDKRNGGSVIGIMKIEDLSFLDLNLSTIHSFALICKLCGEALGTAMNFTSNRGKKADFPVQDSKLHFRGQLNELSDDRRTSSSLFG